MKHRTMLLDIDAVKEALEAVPGPEGIEVDLVDHEKCRFRIKRSEGDVHSGVTDKGEGVFMNTATGQFDIIT